MRKKPVFCLWSFQQRVEWWEMEVDMSHLIQFWLNYIHMLYVQSNLSPVERDLLSSCWWRKTGLLFTIILIESSMVRNGSWHVSLDLIFTYVEGVVVVCTKALVYSFAKEFVAGYLHNWNLFPLQLVGEGDIFDYTSNCPLSRNLSWATSCVNYTHFEV